MTIATLLASDCKSFTEPSHKMLDQKEMKYFVRFEDLLSFCIFAMYELTPLKKYFDRSILQDTFSHFKAHFKLSVAPSFLFGHTIIILYSSNDLTLLKLFPKQQILDSSKL